MDPTPENLAQRIGRLRERRMRGPDQPTLAERRAFGARPGAMRARLRVWADPTLAALMKDVKIDFDRKRKAVAFAAAAWRELLPRNFSVPTSLVSFSRGVLTVSVPDHASRFALDRVLRAGGLSHFIRSVPVAVRDVRVVVGAVHDPIPPLEKRDRSVDDREREGRDEIDAGLAARALDTENAILQALWRHGLGS